MLNTRLCAILPCPGTCVECIFLFVLGVSLWFLTAFLQEFVLGNLQELLLAAFLMFLIEHFQTKTQKSMPFLTRWFSNFNDISFNFEEKIRWEYFFYRWSVLNVIYFQKSLFWIFLLFSCKKLTLASKLAKKPRMVKCFKLFFPIFFSSITKTRKKKHCFWNSLYEKRILSKAIHIFFYIQPYLSYSELE